MKLNECDTDVQRKELEIINKPDSFKDKTHTDDVLILKNLSVVIKYDYIDLGKTDYHFHQDFVLGDTQTYFSKMKEASSSIISNLGKMVREHHSYPPPFTGKVREDILKIMPSADESIITYYFGLYECDSKEARREIGGRFPRIYFVLGNYGSIYILFSDPFHELNP